MGSVSGGELHLLFHTIRFGILNFICIVCVDVKLILTGLLNTPKTPRVGDRLTVIAASKSAVFKAGPIWTCFES